MVTRRLRISKQTCSFQLQVCLSMCDLLLPPGIKGLSGMLQNKITRKTFHILKSMGKYYFVCVVDIVLEKTHLRLIAKKYIYQKSYMVKLSGSS